MTHDNWIFVVLAVLLLVTVIGMFLLIAFMPMNSNTHPKPKKKGKP